MELHLSPGRYVHMHMLWSPAATHAISPQRTRLAAQLSASSRVVVLRYEDLANPDVDISAQLEEVGRCY